MDSATFDDVILKDENFPDFLLLDFEESLVASKAGRKSNSLNDLVRNQRKPLAPGAAASYRNVESKVKNYIASLPAPADNGRRKVFKKHTSMPASYFGDKPDSCRCEQELSEFKRQSDYTINELRTKLDVSVALIGEVNMEKFDLMDRIERMRMDVQVENSLNKPTPEINYNPVQMLKNVCTPKKRAIPTAKHRQLIKNDASGSFLGDTNLPPSASSAVIVPTAMEMTHLTPIDRELRKRNLSFTSTGGGDVTRRSNGTDSGINTSEENEPQVPVPVVSARKRTKRKRVKKFLASFICCVPRRHSHVYKQM